MKQIDLDDLPPRAAELLAGLQEGEALLVVRHGAVVARLAAIAPPAPLPEESFAELSPEERMKEVLGQFNAMIHDEF